MTTTEHITVLFTDLVGSTELQSALPPEVADDVRNRHFSALRQAIASSGGTEVKNLGDGLMVVFPAASSALGCAVSMQQVVHRDNVGADRPLGLRVGLSSGDATKEEGDYFGDPVIVGARLCAKARAGQILAADVVKFAAGRRSPHAFTSLGGLELKGLPEPVETLDVAWAPLGGDVLEPGTVPLPTRLGHTPEVGVIGRQDELAALETAAKRVASGEGRELLFVVGEPGQGKTTLVAEFARRAHEAHMTVLLGRCDEELGAPYQPFHEALSHLVAHSHESVLRSHVVAHGGELDRMVPALRQRLGDLPAPQSTDADTERYLLYGAAAGLLEATSTDTPVVLVLDDLHWADKPSLQLLRHLVARSATLRLLIVGTYRDAELSSTHPLETALAALHREPAGISTIEVKGLDDTGVVALMEAAAGHQLDDAGLGLAHQLYRETDGNPFFVAEVLRHLSESGAIFQDPTTGRWTAGEEEQLALPHSVRSVIGTRVARLGEAAIKVLTAASVIGRDFDLDLLAETTDLAEDDLLDLLEEAERAAVVQEVDGAPGRYSFSHALIQHTLYEDLSATRRTRVHRQVGEAIEHLYPNEPGEYAGELARHFFLATKPTDATKAITYSKRAGDAALEALAPDDAVRYFSQALELSSQTPALESGLRIDLLIGLGTAQRQAGIATFRETLLDAARAARASGDGPRLVRAAVANDRGTFSTVDSVDAEKVAVLEQALAQVGSAAADRAQLLATLCSESTVGTSLEHRMKLAEEAIAVARATEDDETIVRVLNHLLLPLAVPPLIDRVLEWSTEALDRALLLDDPLLLCAAASGRRFAAACTGDLVEVDRCFALKAPIVAKLDQPFLLWVDSLQRGTRALIAGDTEDAERLAAEALELGMDGGQPDAPVAFGMQMLMVSLWRGTMGDLVPLIDQAIKDNPGLQVFRAALALAHSEGGHHDEAQRELRSFAESGFKLPMDVTWLTGMTAYATAVIESNAVDLAGPLFEILSPYAGQWHYSDVAAAGPVSRTVGGLATLLGRFDDAHDYLSTAASSSKLAGAKFFTAWTDLYQSRMLMARDAPGDAEKARPLLMATAETSAANGYGNLEKRARVALAAWQ